MARRRKKKTKQGEASEPRGASPSPATATVAGPLPAARPLGPMTGAPPAGYGPRPLTIDLRALAIGAVIVLTLAFLWAIRELWTTFLFTAVVVFLGNPLVERLEARGVPRAAGAALFLLIGALALTGLSLLIVPSLIRELGDLFRKLPEAFSRLEIWVESTFDVNVPGNIGELVEQVTGELDTAGGGGGDTAGALKSGGAALGKGAVGLWNIILGAVGAAGRAIFIPVLAFFALTELPDMRQFFRALTPGALYARVTPVLTKVHKALAGMLRGQLTVAMIMAVIYAIGLSISGVPLALAISILSGVAYLIPFASATVCLVLSVIFTLLEVGEGVIGPLIGATITAIVVQALEGWVLTPRVVGDSAGLSPIAVLLAVLIAGNLFGFLGVLFALPLGAALGVVLKEKALGAS